MYEYFGIYIHANVSCAEFLPLWVFWKLQPTFLFLKQRNPSVDLTVGVKVCVPQFLYMSSVNEYMKILSVT